MTHFTDPTFVGNIDSPEVEIIVGNSVCGDRIEVQLIVQGTVISDVSFRAWGCATSVATGDIFCNSVKGEKFEEIALRDRDYFSKMLGELEPSQRHCIDIMEELHTKLCRETRKLL